MTVKKDLTQTKELTNSLRILATSMGKAKKDGKIDIQDLPTAIELLTKADQVMEGFKGLSEMKEELADLDGMEVVELVGELVSVGEAYEEARKA